MKKIKKAIHRIFRILTGRRGVYCTMGRGNRFCPGVFLHEMTEIGNYNYFGHGTMTLNARIGSYCSVASNVKVGQMDHDLGCVSTSTHIFGPSHGITDVTGYIEPAIIGDDVWIAANVCIKQGVKIGTGAVVGAGAVVTKDVPPYAIVAGVPARIIRYRFDPETVDMLIESKWWELPPDEAVKNCKELQKEIIDRSEVTDG